MLQACYDLAYCPASYDVVAFLLNIEAERIRLKYDGIELFITPGPVGGFRADKFWPHNAGYRKTLFDRVVIPMCRMLPSIVSIAQVPIAHNAFGHGRGMYGFPLMLQAMKIAGRPLRPRWPIQKAPKRVTITLREGEHWPTRNSNMTEWMRAATQIRARGYDIIFVRDTVNAGVAMPGFSIDPQASLDLDFRSSLYRSAFCNFFVSNGPAWLAMCCNVPTIVMKPTTDGLLFCYTRHYFQRNGLDDQLPNNPPHQAIVWKDDTEAEIVSAFERFEEANSADRTLSEDAPRRREHEGGTGQAHR